MTRTSRVLLALALAGCASGPGEPYWRKAGGTSAGFASDNQTCSARASRVSPGIPGDRRGAGLYVPDNRMQTPPRPWTNPAAQSAYMDCMAERGWSAANR